MLYFTKKVFLLLSFTGAVAVCGDFVVSKAQDSWVKALADNVTHALIGTFSWLSISVLQLNVIKKDNLQEALICTFIASFIDLDHFISALSWKLSDATQLKSRPFLHNTTFLTIGIFGLFLVAYFYSWTPLTTLSWILLTAGISHHIRDATRRGFLLWPLTSTRPVPYSLYIALQISFPILIASAQIWFRPHAKALASLLEDV